MAPIDPIPGALLDLLPEWELALRAEDKTTGTIEAYSGGTRRYLDWCVAANVARCSGLRCRPLSTGQVPGDPFLDVKGPAQRRQIVLPLSDDELRALIAICTHPVHRPDEKLHHRRDEALIRLMLETGIRAGEVVALDLTDLDLDIHRITLRRGEGGHLRTMPVGSNTIAAIRAHLPERAQHPAAAAPSTPASTDSTCTGSGTPPRTAGSPPAAPSPG